MRKKFLRCYQIGLVKVKKSQPSSMQILRQQSSYLLPSSPGLIKDVRVTMTGGGKERRQGKPDRKAAVAVRVD